MLEVPDLVFFPSFSKYDYCKGNVVLVCSHKLKTHIHKIIMLLGTWMLYYSVATMFNMSANTVRNNNMAVHWTHHSSHILFEFYTKFEGNKLDTEKNNNVKLHAKLQEHQCREITIFKIRVDIKSNFIFWFYSSSQF